MLSTTGIYRDVPYLKTYLNYECKTLCLIDHSFLHGIDYCPISKDDIWSKLGITKPKSLKYFYSSYTIDENGYVKTIPFEKEDFPGYMNY